MPLDYESAGIESEFTPYIARAGSGYYLLAIIQIAGLTVAAIFAGSAIQNWGNKYAGWIFVIGIPLSIVEIFVIGGPAWLYLMTFGDALTRAQRQIFLWISILPTALSVLSTIMLFIREFTTLLGGH